MTENRRVRADRLAQIHEMGRNRRQASGNDKDVLCKPRDQEAIRRPIDEAKDREGERIARALGLKPEPGRLARYWALNGLLEVVTSAELYEKVVRLVHEATSEEDPLNGPPMPTGATMESLVREVMSWHADPRSPDYNGCDTDPCHWCAQAIALAGRGDDRPDAQPGQQAKPASLGARPNCGCSLDDKETR